MNLPNRLTVIRIFLSPLILLLLMIDFPFHYVTAGVVFGLAALTDLFDGRIARSQGLVTNFGKFLDPIADKMLTTAVFLGFLAIGRIDVWAVMLILSREFVVASTRMLAASNGVVIAAVHSGKAKTVAQYVAIIYMFIALEFSSWQNSVLSGYNLPDLVYSLPLLLGRVLIWISVVLTVYSGFQIVWNSRRHVMDEKQK